MKKLVILLCSMWTLSSIAGEKIDKQLDVSATGEVEIHNTRGKIELQGWDKNVVRVKGELDNMTEKFVFNHNDGKTLIKVVLPKSYSTSKRSRGSKLKIFVPLQVALYINGVSTDLDISNVQGGVEINTVSGDAVLKNIAKRTYINSVSGDVDLNDVKGRIEISTVSGDVKAKVTATKISIAGVSSDITVKASSFDTAKIVTVSGDAHFYGSLLADGDLRMNNVSGDSFFHVRGELDARITLETGPGGDIVNKYSSDKPTSSFIGSESLKFTSGEGSGTVRMHTVSGSIGLKK
ncbi:MAG: DUF4097 family beta strand repeat-containing protein [Kangiellaceae bacterium]|nr:DUF4097 family beta strand repeat-containing protein [Kangiellaceae bacterium]